MEIAEGREDKLLLTFEYYTGGPMLSEVLFTAAPLGGESGEFEEPIVVFADSGIAFRAPRIDTDEEADLEYYAFVVAEAVSYDNYYEIWFSRSTDLGVSFEPPYSIAGAPNDDHGYFNPDISAGFGGYIHVTWEDVNHQPGTGKDIIYQRCPNLANGGQSSWEPVRIVSNPNDVIWEEAPKVHADLTSDDLILVFPCFDSDYNAMPSRLLVSADHGNTFNDISISTAFTHIYDVACSPLEELWAIGGLCNKRIGYVPLELAATKPRSDFVVLSDNDFTRFNSWYGDLVRDPSHAEGLAMIWTVRLSDGSGDDHLTYFDANWRGRPGYPNLEDGFPKEYARSLISAPTLVDLTGDGNLEIVFTETRYIHAVDHEGEPLWNWPVYTGQDLAGGSLAVGDLQDDGDWTVVVGGQDGQAYAYDMSGDLLPGWPVTVTSAEENVYVSIGALAASAPRSVVCAGGHVLTTFNKDGEHPPGGASWLIPAYTFRDPAAVGDVDNDGVAEIVAASGPQVFCAEADENHPAFSVFLPANVSDAITLGDLDNDGDLEIFCPTVDGKLHVLDHTGAPQGGSWPYDAGSSSFDSALSSASLAWAQGTSEMQVVFMNRTGVYQLDAQGVLQESFPVMISFDLFGTEAAPVIGPVNDEMSDIVVGDREHWIWAWDFQGELIEGWPRDIGSLVFYSPALGDLDMDGATEVVFTAGHTLVVMDVGQAPGTAFNTWPMDGYDYQHTGCANCDEDMLVAAPLDGITRVSFTGPTPNPVAGMVEFSFAVPQRAVANLEIFDVRGRRVRTIFRDEVEEGPRVVTWDGRGKEGALLASGVYLAQLHVQGPGVSETLIRKVTVVR